MNAFPTFVDLEHGVDKTAAIAEWLGDRHSLVFCRPAGFGRDEWLDVLQAYLDEAAAPQFDARFAGTWIAAHPTRDRSARRVMRLSFKGCSGSDGKAVFIERLKEGMRDFLMRYPDAGTTAFLTRESDSPAGLWDIFTCEVMPAVRRLTVLIDDVDGTADVGATADCCWEKAKRWLTVFYETLKASQHLLGTRVYAVGENPAVLMELRFSGFSVMSPRTLGTPRFAEYRWEPRVVRKRRMSIGSAAYLTYSEKSDRTMLWAETAFRA